MNHPSGTPLSNALPQTPVSRIFSLDVLRGIALLGILLVSIWQFGGLGPAEQTKLRLIHHGGNYTLFTSISVFIEGKMRALFSIVFGAGIILFLSRPAYPSSLSSTDLYMRKQLWLIAFGVFNAVILLWSGDILFHYGIVGILLFAFWRMPARGLLIAAFITTLIFCGKTFWDYGDDRQKYKKFLAIKVVEKKFSQDSLQRAKKDSIWALQYKASMPATVDSIKQVFGKDSAAKEKATAIKKLQNDLLAKEAAKDTLTKEQKKDKGAWEATIKGLKYDSSAAAANVKSMRGNYAQVWKYILPETQSREAMWLYRTGIWDIGSMMLLGMALFAFGFFSGSYPVKKYWIIALPCIAAGLLLAWFRQDHLHEKLVDYAKYIDSNRIPANQFFPLERVLLATGYASLVMILIRIKILNWLWNALADTGRMALTNYLVQTLICTFFFYGYGMGNFGRLSQVQLYFLVMEIWLVQVVFSVFWFRHFLIGPLEWVWRRLIYGIWFPIKKIPATGSPATETTTN